jgi:hemoglobin/transferrin/lactoferrin receptor protein
MLTSRHVLTALVVLGARGAFAQSDTTTRDTSRHVTTLSAINVTATRSPRDVFGTPAPVTVLSGSAARQRGVDNIAQMFGDEAGLDLTGVGPNQGRPEIRGQRGQRILLLEDGLRLNNSRRQQDFGEVPALVDVASIERVEVVRGPASVLYGSDAIGGVVNIITQAPVFEAGAPSWRGGVAYGYGTAEQEQRVSGSVAGHAGGLAVLLTGSYRDGQPYLAPAGNYGAITLASDTKVNDSGIKDGSGSAYVGYRFSPQHGVFARIEGYRADTAGFGWVDPHAYNPDTTLIQILYPQQHFERYVAGYDGSALNLPIADKLSVNVYGQHNERHLNQHIVSGFGPSAPPGSGVIVNTFNQTDMQTYGFRVEAKKVAGSAVMLTYGADLFHDASTNTDSSGTTVVGFGPPNESSSTTPQLPNATFRNLGAFVQGDIRVIDRGSIVLGARYEDVQAATDVTPNLADPPVTSTDRTVVGSASALYGVTGNLNLIASVGRGFRSPNLVERFFNGPTPEGSAFQTRNPDLKPETSLNVDLGVRFRSAGLSFESFAFQNDVHDGIAVAPTGQNVGPLPEFQNVNVDRLRYRGVEVSAAYSFAGGLVAGGNYTHLTSENVLDPNNPVGDSYSDKLNLMAGYDDPSDRFYVRYRVRHNGDQKDVQLGANPVGAVLPAFTVHSVELGATVLKVRGRSQRVGVTLNNLGNALYAEFPNVSFFRPEPRRSATLMVSTEL